MRHACHGAVADDRPRRYLALSICTVEDPRAQISHSHQIVTAKILQRLWGSVALDVFARCSDIEHHLSYRSCDLISWQRFWMGCHPQCKVISLLDEVDDAVLEGDIDNDVWIGLLIKSQCVSNALAGEPTGAGDSEGTAWSGI